MRYNNQYNYVASYIVSNILYVAYSSLHKNNLTIGVSQCFYGLLSSAL